MSMTNLRDGLFKAAKDIREDWHEFADTRSLRSAFNLASHGLVIAGAAAVVGLLWKPAFLATLGIAAVKGYQAWNTPAAESSGSAPPAPPSPA